MKKLLTTIALLACLVAPVSGAEFGSVNGKVGTFTALTNAGSPVLKASDTNGWFTLAGGTNTHWARGEMPVNQTYSDLVAELCSYTNEVFDTSGYFEPTIAAFITPASGGGLLTVDSFLYSDSDLNTHARFIAQLYTNGVMMSGRLAYHQDYGFHPMYDQGVHFRIIEEVPANCTNQIYYLINPPGSDPDFVLKTNTLASRGSIASVTYQLKMPVGGAGGLPASTTNDMVTFAMTNGWDVSGGAARYFVRAELSENQAVADGVGEQFAFSNVIDNVGLHYKTNVMAFVTPAAGSMSVGLSYFMAVEENTLHDPSVLTNNVVIYKSRDKRVAGSSTVVGIGNFRSWGPFHCDSAVTVTVSHLHDENGSEADSTLTASGDLRSWVTYDFTED